MRLEQVKIKDLVLAEYNPRKTGRKVIEKLKNSITEFGFVNPLIVNARNNVIIGGNQRYQALKELYGDDKEVPVVYLELDEPKEKALNIALNKIGSDWEQEKLLKILTELNDLDLSGLTGFDMSELQILDIGAVPEIHINPSKIKSITFPLIFHFDKIEDKLEAERFFSSRKLGWKSSEPNIRMLMELIKDNDGNKNKG